MTECHACMANTEHVSDLMNCSTHLVILIQYQGQGAERQLEASKKGRKVQEEGLFTFKDHLLKKLP